MNSHRIGLVRQPVFHCFGTPILLPCDHVSITATFIEGKNSLLKLIICYNVKYTFIFNIFHYMAPRILRCMRFSNLNSSHNSRKVTGPFSLTPLPPQKKLNTCGDAYFLRFSRQHYLHVKYVSARNHFSKSER